MDFGLDGGCTATPRGKHLDGNACVVPDDPPDHFFRHPGAVRAFREGARPVGFVPAEKLIIGIIPPGVQNARRELARDQPGWPGKHQPSGGKREVQYSCSRIVSLQ